MLAIYDLLSIRALTLRLLDPRSGFFHQKHSKVKQLRTIQRPSKKSEELIKIDAQSEIPATLREATGIALLRP